MTTDTTTEAPQEIVFLRLPDVLRRLPVGKTKLYAAISEGEAPKPCKLGGVSMWPKHEIDALAAKMMAERDA